MIHRSLGSLITGIAGVGFIGTAALHTTGYDSVTRLAEQAPADIAAVMPALWLVFSFDLAVLGLIILVVARWPMARGSLILVIAAIAPVAAAGLQIKFLGFMAPTAILLAVGGLTLIAAMIQRPTG